jgi:hypothetical protein
MRGREKEKHGPMIYIRLVYLTQKAYFSTMFHATLLHQYQMWDEVKKKNNMG